MIIRCLADMYLPYYGITQKISRYELILLSDVLLICTFPIIRCLADMILSYYQMLSWYVLILLSDI